ncbi:trimethylamine methyltransferase family protein, partial [candidate division CSSED10-310 bacterium]
MEKNWIRPHLNILDREFIERIIEEAYTLLHKVGVQVESAEALELLGSHGARVEHDKAYLPQELVEKCLATVPRTISLYDRDGVLAGQLTGDNVHFDPGSAALNILEADGKTVRKPVTEDLVKFARLVEGLDNFAFQSTALICSDVPTDIADRYRLFLVLQYCRKPVVTGTFHEDAFEVMHRMLALVRGGEQQLREKPLAIFDCCPSSPLKWSQLTVHD